METLPNAASLTVKVVKYYGDVRVFHSELKLPTQDPVTGHTAAYPSGGVAWVTAGAETSMTGRNIYGVQGVHLTALGLFLCTSTPCIWHIPSACLPS